MKMTFALTLFLVAMQASAETSYMEKAKKYINSIGVSLDSPGTTTNYTVNSGLVNEEELSFETIGIPFYLYTIDTKFLEIGVASPSLGDDEIENTRYNYFHLAKSYKNFRISYASARYRGGYIDTISAQKGDKFYPDFKGESRVFELDYFNDMEYKVALDSAYQAQKQRAKTGENYFDSMIISTGHRITKTTFPERGSLEVSSYVSNALSADNYITELDTENTFLTMGYGGYHLLTDNFNYHFHINYGIGLQNINSETENEFITKSASTSYMQISFGLGYMINTRHHLGLSTYQSSETAEINDTSISNSQRITSIFYTYYL